MAGIHVTDAGGPSSTPAGTSSDSSVDPSKMTFGIELEFLVVHPDGCFARLELDGISNAVKAIHHLINARGVAVQCFYYAPVGAPRFSRWTIDLDNQKLTEAEKVHCPPNHTVVPVEISSRKMSFFNDDWQQEVSTVLDATNELQCFGGLLLVNQNCGFHVHIGFDDQFVPINACKNLLQISTALERCFDQIHTTSRIVPGDGVSFDHPRHFNAPLSWFHTQSASTSADETVFDWLCKIEDCETHKDIDRMFNIYWPSNGGTRRLHGHFSVLNFGNCINDAFAVDDSATGTVEFRQHEGTLDRDDIYAWVSLTARLVRFCNSADPKDIVSMCCNAWNQDYSIYDLMQKIGCNEQQIAYYHQRRCPNSHASGSDSAIQDRARLEAGEYSGLEAMWMQSGLDSFDRRDPLAVGAVSWQKLYSGAQGRRIRYDPTDLANALAVYDTAAAKTRAGGQTISSAKKIAFSWMGHS